MTSTEQTTTRAMLRQILDALALPPGTDDGLEIEGEGSLPARYPVSDLACAASGSAALALGQWMAPRQPPPVRLDRALASWWFGYTLAPDGWALPRVRAAITGDYRAQDGWIRIHANALSHRQRARQVLGLTGEARHQDVAAAVSRWPVQALEDALVEHDACAAALHAPEVWTTHPQGQAVAAEPLIHLEPGLAAPIPRPSSPDTRKPLKEIRILDLTRVLAGPVATRFLAAYGAQVLRLDPADWEEPGMVPEVTAGKRCALLDLHTAAGLDRFKALLAQADVLVHGYRPGALDRLGLDAATRQAIRPGLVDVCLSAWGWSGPWRMRRGFDSLVQMSTGIAAPGRPDAAPEPLPVQALDQATGYLMAACALCGLTRRREQARGSLWRVSLARTARLLVSAACTQDSAPPSCTLGAPPPDAYDPVTETTAWGPARRLRAPCTVGNARWSWDRGAVPLRGDQAEFA